MMGHRRLIGNVRGPALLVSLELVKDRNTKEPPPEAAAEVYRLRVPKGVLFAENRYAGLGNLITINPSLDVTRTNVARARRARRGAGDHRTEHGVWGATKQKVRLRTSFDRLSRQKESTE